MQVELINTLAQPLKTVSKFVARQETATGLGTSRFLMDTATNWVPKATFARSKADLAENTFLEFSESALVYFAPALVGEKIARKVFSSGLDKQAKNAISAPAVQIMKKAPELGKKVLPVKAAIALTALLIPLTEFCLNYFKNMFTLKLFKKGDFNNIANLENNEEEKANQEKVKKSAKKNITRAALVFAGSLALGGLLAAKGKDSKALQNLSEAILAPGTKFFKNSPKVRDFLDKYFSMDFNQQAGKLTLSKGQLTACVLIGGVGYFGAAKDRGKQNLLETAFRYPLVGLYVITGSELFEKGFKKLLQKAGKCTDLIGKNLETPKFEQLGELAKNLSKNSGKPVEQEFKRLAKQKAVISGVPFLFSIGFMGFFVAGISNLFTRFRHKKEQEKYMAQSSSFSNTLLFKDKGDVPEVYSNFFK